MGECCLLHHKIHGLEGIFHLPDTASIKFMSVFSVFGCHFPSSVFAKLILFICLSKMFFYQNHQKSLHTVIDLCYAAVLATFMCWCDLVFSGSITLYHFLPQNYQLIHLKWLMCDQQFTSRSKRCNIWSFVSGMSTVSQTSIMFHSPQSCHMSTPYPSNDNLVPKKL